MHLYFKYHVKSPAALWDQRLLVWTKRRGSTQVKILCHRTCRERGLRAASGFFIFIPARPPHRRLKGGSLGESRRFKRYLRTCISHNLKTLFVFVVQDTVSMRGAAKPSEHTVIWAKDAFIPSFHFQDLFRSSCDILLCKYCSARESGLWRFNLLWKLFIIARMKVIYLMRVRGWKWLFHCGTFCDGAGWSNLFNFGFHTSGDEKRSELIYRLLGPSGSPSSACGCYGQPDLNLCVSVCEGLKQFFFF